MKTKIQTFPNPYFLKESQGVLKNQIALQQLFHPKPHPLVGYDFRYHQQRRRQHKEYLGIS